MKKIIILLAVLSFSTFVWSQTLDLRGTYKSQTFKAKGRYRPDGTVEITSFSYAPYDKLDGEVKTLKSQKKELENRVKELEKGGGGGGGSEEIKNLNKRLEKVTNDLNDRSAELDRVKSDMAALKSQMQDSAALYRTSMGKYRTALKSMDEEIASKDKKIAELELRVKGKGLNRNTIGVEFSYGSSVMKNEFTKQDFWKHTFSPSIQFMADYTYYFNEKQPFAVKAGLGYATYNGNISAVQILDTISGLVDDDGDKYDARYCYSNLVEKVSLSYLEIPILLHVGNSFTTNGVQAWIEAGVKAGINIGSRFEGDGTYSCEGFYPQWNLTMSDVPALGFVNDGKVYDNVKEVEPSKFVLWGIVNAGINIPISNKAAFMVGVQCSYSLIPVAKGDAMDNRYMRERANILSGESTNIFNLGAKVGLKFNL